MRFFIYLILFVGQMVWAQNSFLVITDIHYGKYNSSKDGKDTGPDLLASAMEKFSELTKNVDFIVTLGDFPTHSIIPTSETKANIKTVFEELYKANQWKKPIFYITGNNDGWNGNYQPFSNNHKSSLSLASDWGDGPCLYCKNMLLDDTFLKDKGYYSTYVIPNNKDILLIALNSIQFSQQPFYLSHYPHKEQKADAKQQLSWLEDQLKKNHSKQLLIAMHIPPGFNYHKGLFWQDEYLQKFIGLIKTYANNYGEINLLTAHTHMDEIRKINLDEKKHIYAYANPSISRIHHNNSGLKVYALNDKLQLENYTTYYTINNDKWDDTSYSALYGVNAIFNNCDNTALKACLDSMNGASVCQHLAHNSFYSVKSPRINPSECSIIYLVNENQEPLKEYNNKK